ncbi:Pyruvate/ketoisovalerate oxidoreductase, gamma subunit [uncultured spirochete]|uniref:Pyruvate/ketoisovalerate oxidoreductase, gamma subunit n=1 Tax=uncultured spirochete TaxID=156406 RepID=A0A3P3XTR1_9SPIR|nr:Pyruvate/ketoisovalerate oxidoreductase, gamma subunit [uncultured spirochete]
MTEKTFMAGFGGQGIISLGQLWVYSAMKEGLKVTFFPFYGAEKRGGIARASVIVSDSEIKSPLVTSADSVVVMNQDSVEIAEKVCKEGGTIFVNSSLVKTDPARPDAKIVHVPCNDIALKLGDVRIANMVMMGALGKVTGALKLDKLESILKGFFPARKHSLISLNIAAMEEGKKAVT